MNTSKHLKKKNYTRCELCFFKATPTLSFMLFKRSYSNCAAWRLHHLWVTVCSADDWRRHYANGWESNLKLTVSECCVAMIKGACVFQLPSSKTLRAHGSWRPLIATALGLGVWGGWKVFIGPILSTQRDKKVLLIAREKLLREKITITETWFLSVFAGTGLWSSSFNWPFNAARAVKVVESINLRSACLTLFLFSLCLYCLFGNSTYIIFKKMGTEVNFKLLQWE